MNDTTDSISTAVTTKGLPVVDADTTVTCWGVQDADIDRVHRVRLPPTRSEQADRRDTSTTSTSSDRT